MNIELVTTSNWQSAEGKKQRKRSLYALSWAVHICLKEHKDVKIKKVVITHNFATDLEVEEEWDFNINNASILLDGKYPCEIEKEEDVSGYENIYIYAEKPSGFITRYSYYWER